MHRAEHPRCWQEPAWDINLFRNKISTVSESRARVTLASVAAAAGVSLATASRALSGRRDVAPGTRSRVASAAQALGYLPGREPRGRPRNSVRTIDLVLAHFDTPWAAEVLAGARDEAARAGLDLTLTLERENDPDDWVARVRERGSAGVVLGIVDPTRRQVASLEAASIPLVLLVPRSENDTRAPSIGTTDRRGGGAAARRLVEQGAEHIYVLAGHPRYHYGRARVEGFEDVVRSAGRVEYEIVNSGWTEARARAAILGPLRRSMPTGKRIAVFATADALAMGVYAAAADLGLGIPDDLLVVGFDDIPTARLMNPPLTTVRQPIREMAARAVRLLLDGTAPTRRHDLPTRLIVRGSA